MNIIQPIPRYPLPNQWSAGTSEMNITYDWNENDWVALPLGVKLNSLGSQKVPFSAAYEYNFANDRVGPEWNTKVTAKFLFPL